MPGAKTVIVCFSGESVHKGRGVRFSK
jgi:hypothetical protein